MSGKAVTAVILVIVVLAGAAYLLMPRPAPGVQKKLPGKIRLGVILPLSTASYASAGQEALRGIKMAVEEINSNGGVLGKNVELVIRDTKGDPNTAINGATDLITKEKVPIIIGFYSSTVTYASMNAIKGYRPLVFVLGASSVKVESLVGQERWFFHMHPWDYHRQGTVIEFFLHHMKETPKKIFVAYEDGVYGTTSYEYFVNLSKKENASWTVVGESFKTGSSDFSSVVLKAKQQNPDVFYIVGYPGDYPVFFRNEKENNFNPKLTFIVAPEFPGYPKDIGDYVAGVDVWSPYLSTPEARAFVKKFEDKFGRPPEYWAPFGYTATKMACKAIENVKSLSKENLINALEKVQIESPLGTVKFKQTGKTLHQVVDRLFVVQWQKGKVVILYPEEYKSGNLIYPVLTWSQRGG